MRVSLKVTKNSTVHAEAETTKDLFRQIAQLSELMGDSNCGKCGKDFLRFVVREHEGNEFFELRCLNPKCKAKLQYGVSKEGGVYPKRVKVDSKGKAIKDDNGKTQYLPDRGWVKFNKETGKNE